MLGRDRFIQLETPVAGVLPALEVLDRVRGAPRGMEAVSVLADVARKAGVTELRKLTIFFTRGAKKDAVCQFDNEALRLTCSSPYPSPPTPGDREPLDLRAVQVDLDEALRLAEQRTGASVAGRSGPDLLVDALLKSVGARPSWEISYDVWPETGPESFHRFRVDAVTGEVETVSGGS